MVDRLIGWEWGKSELQLCRSSGGATGAVDFMHVLCCTLHEKYTVYTQGAVSLDACANERRPWLHDLRVLKDTLR